LQTIHQKTSGDLTSVGFSACLEKISFQQNVASGPFLNRYPFCAKQNAEKRCCRCSRTLCRSFNPALVLIERKAVICNTLIFKCIYCVFLKAKYNVSDIPLSQFRFIVYRKIWFFYLRIERKLKLSSANGIIIQLLSATKTALHRNLIRRLLFFGYKLERPVFQSRTLTVGEFAKLVSKNVPKYVPITAFE
jgi:hypothetical protein